MPMSTEVNKLEVNAAHMTQKGQDKNAFEVKHGRNLSDCYRPYILLWETENKESYS